MGESFSAGADFSFADLTPYKLLEYTDDDGDKLTVGLYTDGEVIFDLEGEHGDPTPVLSAESVKQLVAELVEHANKTIKGANGNE